MDTLRGVLLALSATVVVTATLAQIGGAIDAHYYPEIGSGLGRVLTWMLLILPLSCLGGALVGALILALVSVQLSIFVIWMLWIIVLLYTLYISDMNPSSAIFLIPHQLFVIASTAFLFYNRDTQVWFSDRLRRYALIIIVTMITILFMTLFPPVTRRQDLAGTTTLWPWFAFILDERFDGSLHYPELSLNVATLGFEWIIIGAVALAAAMRVRRN